jgi:putative transcriptional regulator
MLFLLDSLLYRYYNMICKVDTTESEVNKVKNTVKFLRRSAEFDMTQQELAVALGVSRTTVIAIENGGKTSGEIVMKIANLFGKDPREIFFLDCVVSNLQTKSNSA